MEVGRSAELNGGGQIRYQPGDDWQDFNVGSQMEPCQASEACECEDWIRGQGFQRVVTESVAAFRREAS